MSNILVFSEKQELLYEMLSKACQLAGAGQTVIAAGWGSAEVYAKYGADKVYIIDELALNAQVESIVPALNGLIETNAVAIIMVGATKRGKEIAARLGALQDALCITDCKDIRVEGDTVTVQRMIYGGMALQTEKISRYPVIVSVPQKNFKKAECEKAIVSEGVILTGDSRVKVVERKANLQQTVNVEEAEILIVVGRGFEKKEDLALAQELADAVGGVVGCTRPIAEDYHWMEEGLYVGLTGKSSRAKLHFSIGTSGQIQYVAGINDAGTIVSIDSNEKAPIWNATDYGIIGDLYAILPALTNEIRKARG